LWYGRGARRQLRWPIEWQICGAASGGRRRLGRGHEQRQGKRMCALRKKKEKKRRGGHALKKKKKKAWFSFLLFGSLMDILISPFSFH